MSIKHNIIQQLEFKHIYPMNIRWGEQDILGHVNNVQLIRYLECDRVAYCREVLGLDFVPQTNAGWILADLQCTFHSPMYISQSIAFPW